MKELLLVIGMIGFNIFLSNLEVRTNYSKNEQAWVCETMSMLTFVVSGFTVFRALTINLSTSTNEFVAKSIGLIFFQLAMNICFIVI